MENPNHFLQIELSEKASEVTINGCPDALRMLANELHRLASEAEAHGKIHTQNYFSPDWGGIDLETRLLHQDMPCARSFSLRAWPSAVFARRYLHDGT